VGSKLACHWQKAHYDEARDRAIFKRWQPKSVKIIVDGDDVKGAEIVPLESLLVVRHYSLSENWHQRGIMDVAHAKNMATTHAAKCKQLADWLRANVPSRDLHNTIFTGLNEPEVWDREPPELTAAYYVAFLQELHKAGLHGGALSLGVGHPTNGGIIDAPPIWTPYTPVRDALRPGDYLVKHSYWDSRGPEFNFRWWGGDWSQIPWADVPLLIGECGLDQYVSDGSVPASKRGWRGWMNPQEYMNQLAWYDGKLRADKRVHSAQPFTFDFAHPWDSFNIREADFMESLFLPYVESQVGIPDPQPPIPSPTLPEWLHDVSLTLPRHPTKRYPQRVKPADTIVIHHSGVKGRDTTTPEIIARYHVRLGWAGAGYNVIITGDGTAYLANHLNIQGNHVGGHNGHCVGICFTGLFTPGNETPSDAQLVTGRKMLAWMYGQLNLKAENVTGHRDLTGATTKCPGSDWFKQMLGPDSMPTLTAIRWNAEESVREIERGDSGVARARLLASVIAPLYQLEG